MPSLSVHNLPEGVLPPEEIRIGSALRCIGAACGLTEEYRTERSLEEMQGHKGCDWFEVAEEVRSSR